MTQLSSRPKYSTASVRARQRLFDKLGHQWRVGDRLPSIRELAQEMGLAPRTVHRAIGMLAEENFLEARPRQGVFVTDRFTDSQLRALSDADDQPVSDELAGKLIQLVHHFDANNQFILRMASIVEEAVIAQGGRCEYQSLQGERDHKTVDLGDVQGDAFVTFNLASNTSDWLKLSKAKPTLVLSTAAPYPPHVFSRCDVVTVDQEQGGVLAGEALREAGCKTACFIGNAGRQLEALDITSTLRLTGFEHSFDGPVTRIDAPWYGTIAGAEVVKKYVEMKDRPEGIFAASDELAFGFANGAAAHGLRAGRDFQIVGFDGQDSSRAREAGLLTTVEVPCVQMAQASAEQLVSRINSPNSPYRRVMLGCSLLQGSTAELATV